MAKKPAVKRTKWSIPQLETYIRQESLHTERVVFTHHVNARMKKRHITRDLVFETLRKGKIKLRPEPDPKTDDLHCRMEHYVGGMNVKMVVAISDDDPNLILVTAID